MKQQFLRSNDANEVDDDDAIAKYREKENENEKDTGLLLLLLRCRHRLWNPKTKSKRRCITHTSLVSPPLKEIHAKDLCLLCMCVLLSVAHDQQQRKRRRRRKRRKKRRRVKAKQGSLSANLSTSSNQMRELKSHPFS